MISNIFFLLSIVFAAIPFSMYYLYSSIPLYYFNLNIYLHLLIDLSVLFLSVQSNKIFYCPFFRPRIIRNRNEKYSNNKYLSLVNLENKTDIIDNFLYIRTVERNIYLEIL